MDQSYRASAPGGMQQVVRLADHRRRRSRVYFTRGELSQLLSLYSRRVANGEWRDYAIDHAVGIAVFSVFRHTFDRPAFVIVKLHGPGGVTFAVFDGRGRISRGASLAEVLPVFEHRLRLVTD